MLCSILIYVFIYKWHEFFTFYLFIYGTPCLKFEVQIRSSVVILPKLGRSSKFGHSKFSRWIIIAWTSCMFSYISFYLNNFSKFEVQIRSSVPNLGMTTTEFWESERRPPNLEYDPQLEKFINDIIIYEAVEFFGVQSFGVQIRC